MALPAWLFGTDTEYAGGTLLLYTLADIAYRQHHLAASVSIYWGLERNLEQHSMQISDMNLAFEEYDSILDRDIAHVPPYQPSTEAFPSLSIRFAMERHRGDLMSLQWLLVPSKRRLSFAISPITCSIASRSPSCLSCGQLHFRHTPYPTPAPSLEIPFIFPVFTFASSSAISTHSSHWCRSAFFFFRCRNAAK